VQHQIEGLVGGRVVAARNSAGGFSPGFASKLTRADGGSAFAKAIDICAWPDQASMYRDEARNAAGLTAAGLAGALPTPRFRGSCEDDKQVVLAFECVDGREPGLPWRPDQLAAVATAVSRMSVLLTPSPLPLPDDHPRLGGWAELAADTASVDRLRPLSDWAARHLDWLITLERHGLIAARGTALVHFDALPHNILLTHSGAVLVDWPHARLGAPIIDLLTLLASAAATGSIPIRYCVRSRLPLTPIAVTSARCWRRSPDSGWQERWRRRHRAWSRSPRPSFILAAARSAGSCAGLPDRGEGQLDGVGPSINAVA
jgi:hypothetical protein